jgi:nitroimidazol reductase NimA-like FMN-containing flavoprotein (pyridoxamine 5'-phosphate oxidase superfamily)
MWVKTLSTADCAAILTENRLGRLACAMNGQPYVVPIYFVYSANHLFAFSALGRKIEFMRANPLVSVLVEQRGDGAAWKSVVVDGRYEELPDRIGYKVQRDHAWSLLSRHADWWQPGALKPATPSPASGVGHVFFRIAVDEVSGREAGE